MPSNQRLWKKGTHCSVKPSSPTLDFLSRRSAKSRAHIVRDRLKNYDSIQAGYQAGGMVTAEINAILAEEFCADLLAPLYEVYETEKARILDT